MGSVLLLAQLALAAVFITAGVSKLLDMRGARAGLEGFGLSRGAAALGAPLLVSAEIAVAIALIPSASARWGALGAVVLLLIFAAAITNSMARGRRPDCNCFGNLHSAPAGGSTLARNLALAGLAGLVLWRGPGTELDAWVEARSTAELATLGASVTALAFAVLSLSLWSQKRRLVQALADARRATIDALTAAPVKPEGLPVGTIAPESELVTLRGEQRSLASLRAGGRPAVLVFLDPGCGPCHGLVPHVSRWQAALNERLAITVISEGSPDRVRAAWRGHATEVLLDTDTTVTRGAYGMVTWPSAMAIGADGRVAHEVVHSQDGMEALIRTMLERTSPPPRTRASGSDASLLTADDIP